MEAERLINSSCWARLTHLYACSPEKNMENEDEDKDEDEDESRDRPICDCACAQRQTSES